MKMCRRISDNVSLNLRRYQPEYESFTCVCVCIRSIRVLAGFISVVDSSQVPINVILN